MSYGNNQYQNNPYGNSNPYGQAPAQEAGYGYGQVCFFSFCSFSSSLFPPVAKSQ